MKSVVHKWETCVTCVKVLKNSHSNFNNYMNTGKNIFFLSTCNIALKFHSRTVNNYSINSAAIYGHFKNIFKLFKNGSV